MTITRCAFDRTLQALVTGFCEAARGTMHAGSSSFSAGADAEDEDLHSPDHAQWQLLSDDVWNRMARSLGSRLRKRHAEDGGDADMLGFASYQNVLKHWMARGGCKRQRIEDSTQAQSAEASHPPAVARPKLASRPPPPPPSRGKGEGKAAAL